MVSSTAGSGGKGALVLLTAAAGSRSAPVTALATAVTQQAQAGTCERTDLAW